MPTFAPARPSSRRLLVLVASALSMCAPPLIHAQNSASAFVFQYVDAPNPFTSSTANGCFNQNTAPGAVSATAACFVPENPGGHGLLTASGSSSFDPVTGQFKSASSLIADKYTLSQFVPTYDGDGNRVYTGATTPDAAGVYTFVNLNDLYSLSVAPGVTPATISFFLDISGTFRADAQLHGAGGFVDTFVNFCTALAGICGSPAASTDAYYGAAGASARSDGLFGYGQSSNGPTGEAPATFTFDGTADASGMNGRLGLAGLPIEAGTSYGFNFFFGTHAIIFHPTSPFALSLNGCDPRFDPSCVPPDIYTDPIDIDGETSAEFGHTLTYAGYKVFDAAGNDITSSTTLTFQSGLGAVATPEPGTLSLIAGGLCVIAAVARRRLRRANDHAVVV